MLELNDPLWHKLDDAHRDRDIPKLLCELAKTWDDDAASSLFWDCLCHQGTCYGATYAVVPHLLRIAEPEGNKHQRLEIAYFLSSVVLNAFDTRTRHLGEPREEPLQGLPLSLDAWDRKLDVFRSLAANLEGRRRAASDYEQNELLPRYRRILATDPVNAADLEQIELVRSEFHQALPEIRALCQRALRESLQDKYAVTHLLSGAAAADGLCDLARLLSHGSEGSFKCSSCDWEHEYILFEDRVAIYAAENAPSASQARPTAEDRSLLDFKDRIPSRSDGFMQPIQESAEMADSRVTALLALAEQTSSPLPALLLRNFLGSFVCSKCGVEGPIKSI